MDILQVSEWLLSNGYLYRTAKGGFILQPKYQKDLELASKNAKFTPPVKEEGSKEVAIIIPHTPVPNDYSKYNYSQWVEFYQNFIIQSKVPAQLEATNGNVYSANKYSEDGMKAFQKALKEGCKYEILCAAIALYYKSAVRWKKAIGTYMSSGEWRSDYAELLGKANAGSEELSKHIKNTIDNGTGTNYEFG